MTIEPISVCLVGAGPRGLSVLERMCALAAERGDVRRGVRVHVVDPHIAHGGAVWRVDQSPMLLMNTVAAQTTVFADDSVTSIGPVTPGPSLYDWARFIDYFDQQGMLPEPKRRECRELGPNSYPTRALHGWYLRWALQYLVNNALPGLEIILHAHTATELTEAVDGTQSIALSSGQQLGELDAVVLAQGHVPSTTTGEPADLAVFARAHGLLYVPPGSPAEARLTAIKPAEPVAIRGMGLNFFDYLTLLTAGRGGRFVRHQGGALHYCPSGNEPRLFVGSRRGVPAHARGENQKGVSERHIPLFLTADLIDWLRQQARLGRPADFRVDVWPLLDREVRAVYYSTLIAERRCACDAKAFLHRYRATFDGDGPGGYSSEPLAIADSAADSELLLSNGINIGERWDWRAIAQPYGELAGRSDRGHHEWLLGYLRRDLREAERGNRDSPIKAALDVLRDLRNEIRLVVDHGGVDGDSYRRDIQGWYNSLNNFVSIGPPVQRVRELLALAECGVVEFLAPGMTVDRPNDGVGFLVRSSAPGPGRRVRALIDARLHEPDLTATTDPLLRDLVARGACVRHRIPTRRGGHYETTGLAVSARPYHLLDAARRPHPRRFAFGVPTETVHWVTAAGIRPNVNSVIVADADAMARAALAAAATRRDSRVPQPALSA